MDGKARKTNDMASTMAKYKNNVPKCHLYFLNEYATPQRSLRVELERGGERCLWKAKTSMKKMLETKKYMESQLGIK